jgi:hypothetical protein
VAELALANCGPSVVASRDDDAPVYDVMITIEALLEIDPTVLILEVSGLVHVEGIATTALTNDIELAAALNDLFGESGGEDFHLYNLFFVE